MGYNIGVFCYIHSAVISRDRGFSGDDRSQSPSCPSRAVRQKPLSVKNLSRICVRRHSVGHTSASVHLLSCLSLAALGTWLHKVLSSLLWAGALTPQVPSHLSCSEVTAVQDPLFPIQLTDYPVLYQALQISFASAHLAPVLAWHSFGSGKIAGRGVREQQPSSRSLPLLLEQWNPACRESKSVASNVREAETWRRARQQKVTRCVVEHKTPATDTITISVPNSFDTI